MANAPRPIVPAGGVWSSVVVSNDTYRTRAIALSSGMDGTNIVVISAARDTEGALVQTAPIYELVVDATLPRVNSVLASSSSGNAVITWTSDEPATSQVEYGATTSYGRNTPLSVALTTSHRVLVTGLAPDTVYNFRVRSRDKAGNETFSSNATFRTLRAPDLFVSGIQVLPVQNLMSGSEITVVWTNANNGVGPASGSWFDQLIVSNKTTGALLLENFVYYDAIRMGDIASGANKVAQYSLNLPNGPAGAGDLVFVVTVDYYNNLIEDNAAHNAEGNNRFTATRTSTIRPYPDLQVQSLAIAPSALKSGTEVTVTWKTANTGSAPAGGVISDRIMIRNSTTGEWLVNQLLPYDTTSSGNSPIAGASALDRSFKFKLADGNRGVGEIVAEVETDVAKTVFEHNLGNTGEVNNSATARATSTLSSYPDLAVTAITAPLNAQAGQTIQVSWTVQNRGTGEAKASWVEHVYLATDVNGANAQLLGSFNSSSPIAAQGNIVRSLPVTMPQFGTGNRWFVVRVDAGNALFESDEANNVTVDDRAAGMPSTLILAVSRNSLPENSGPSGLTGYITRNSGAENALTLALASGTPGKATVPQNVTIPAGQSSTTFPIAIVNNNLVDGDQSATITATAAGFENSSISFTVTDDDAPIITVTVNPLSIREDGGASAAQGTLSRNTATTAALAVSLASGDPNRITVPGSITIPAGQRTVAFPVATVDNSVPNRPVSISINASVQGYQSIPALVELVDDDLPALSLTLTETSVSEGAPNPAVYGTVTRNPVKNRALTVLLHSSDQFAAKAPVSVTIPENEASVTFPISIVNNDLVDLAREVQIMAFTADTIYETPINQGSGVGILHVTDDDGPTLKINLSGQVLSERGNLTATVERNTATASQLVVNLASEDQTEATAPRTVIIPAGQRTGQFTISGVVDGQADGIQPASVIASATGFTSGRASFNVTDVDLPDLRVTQVTVPLQGITGGSMNVSWIVKNEGIATANGPWVDRVYIATSQDGAGLQSVGQFFRTTSVAVGESYERSAIIALPFNPGNFYLMVITDAAEAVEEGAERNNTALSTSTFAIAPAYRATVETAVNNTQSGVPVKLNGRAFKTGSGDPAPFALVSVRLNVKGTRRLIDARSDANGNFETTFVPLPNEAGHVVIGADHPGVQEDPVQDEFNIFGVRFTDHDLSLRLFPMSVLTGNIGLQNLADQPLTGVSIVAEGLPAGISMSFNLTNRLVANELLEIPYTLNVDNITTELRVQARLKVSTTEGAIAYMPVSLTIAPHRATLVANPGVLSQGMLRGNQQLVEFNVSNVGGASSGPLEVRVPPVPWLSLVSPVALPALAPREVTRVVIRLSPPADLPLTRYDGSLVIGSSSSASVNVPFSFRAISEAVGDLRVEVKDDYTYHVAGAPRVQGANVTLTDPLSGAIIATGLSDADGFATFTNLFEGSYQMTVTAPKHSQYRGPVTIIPGTLTDVSTFIDRQTVTYRWTVVPTEVEDRYKVVLESVFETEVPIPVVTIDNPMMMPLIVEGRDTQMEIKVTNHGLIAAERVSVQTPAHPDFEIIPLVDVIDVLPAKSTMSIPVIMRAKPSAQFVNLDMLNDRLAFRDKLVDRQGGTTFTGCAVYPKLQVKWSFVCGPDRRWHVNDASIVPVCVEESCWDKIKDLLEDKATSNPKDLLEWKDQLCELAGVLASCLDECMATIVKTACGVATGDVAGAVGGALGFGQCWCPTLPTIPVGPGTSNPPPLITGIGGGGGGLIGTPDFPIGVGFSWDYSPNCNPGDTVSGGNSLGRQTVRDGAVCARVRLRIEQEAVVTRAAFLGTLELDNGRTDISLTDLQMTLDIKDEFGAPAGERFAIRGPILDNLTAVDGSGVIAPGATGSAKFTFIPNRLAAPDGPRVFKIGGTLKYKEGDNVVEVPLIPDTITVYPDPVLNLVYFQQRDVYSDDPFTDEIEPAEPFGLGLLVKNTGKGAAINFRITSAQPEIIENEKGLLINFKIIGTQVGNEEVTPTLTANLGRIEPGQSKTAMWKLLSTLQGKFVEYKATFEHVD
ncbi:MAG: CARDB domain-containing protein [Verrucomicrobiales bacterium]